MKMSTCTTFIMFRSFIINKLDIVHIFISQNVSLADLFFYVTTAALLFHRATGL